MSDYRSLATVYNVIDGRVHRRGVWGVDNHYLGTGGGGLDEKGQAIWWFPLDLEAHPDVQEAWENIPQWACTRCGYTTNDKADISGCKIKMWGSNQFVHSFENNRPDGLYTLVKRECERCVGVGDIKAIDYVDHLHVKSGEPCPDCANNATPGYVNVFERREDE